MQRPQSLQTTATTYTGSRDGSSGGGRYVGELPSSLYEGTETSQEAATATIQVDTVHVAAAPPAVHVAVAAPPVGDAVLSSEWSGVCEAVVSFGGDDEEEGGDDDKLTTGTGAARRARFYTALRSTDLAKDASPIASTFDKHIRASARENVVPEPLHLVRRQPPCRGDAVRLGHYGIGAAAATALADTIAHLPPDCNRLDLNSNRLDAASLMTLARALTTTTNHFRRIDLSNNPWAKTLPGNPHVHACAESLAAFLCGGGCLVEELVLAGCKLRDREVACIVDGLAEIVGGQKKQLQTLDLSDNEIVGGQGCADALRRAMFSCKLLSRLDLGEWCNDKRTT